MAFAAWDKIGGMAAGEDQQNAAKVSPADLSTLLRIAASAAGLLERACAPEAGDPLRLEIVRTLARDLRDELEALSGVAERPGVVEGALRATDVANLAACTAPDLLEVSAVEAVAATHLAAGAARALCALAGASIGDAPEEYTQNALKDLRGAVWRAQLATRQVDEFLGETVYTDSE
jgi:hypothetical protein